MQVVIVGSGRADLVAQRGTYALGFGVLLRVSLGLRWQSRS